MPHYTMEKRAVGATDDDGAGEEFRYFAVDEERNFELATAFENPITAEEIIRRANAGEKYFDRIPEVPRNAEWPRTTSAAQKPFAPVGREPHQRFAKTDGVQGRPAARPVLERAERPPLYTGPPSVDPAGGGRSELGDPVGGGDAGDSTDQPDVIVNKG